jgi:hypothetical protein
MEVVDKYGEHVTGAVPKHAMCCMVASIGGEPIACAYANGHRSLHSWAALPGAPGSRPPGHRGADRTAAARRPR